MVYRKKWPRIADPKVGTIVPSVSKRRQEAFLDAWWSVDPNTFEELHQTCKGVGAAMISHLAFRANLPGERAKKGAKVYLQVLKRIKGVK